MCLSFLVEIGNLCVERTRCFAVCTFPDEAACPPRSVAVLRCSAEGRPDLRALPALLLGALQELHESAIGQFLQTPGQLHARVHSTGHWPEQELSGPLPKCKPRRHRRPSGLEGRPPRRHDVPFGKQEYAEPLPTARAGPVSRNLPANPLESQLASSLAAPLSPHQLLREGAGHLGEEVAAAPRLDIACTFVRPKPAKCRMMRRLPDRGPATCDRPSPTGSGPRDGESGAQASPAQAHAS